ncbi:MAG: hypothetical protein RJA16_1064, partial [Planctomycetota bacterium]
MLQSSRTNWKLAAAAAVAFGLGLPAMAVPLTTLFSNSNGNTAAILAACNGHGECLELLTKAGADLEGAAAEGVQQRLQSTHAEKPADRKTVAPRRGLEQRASRARGSVVLDASHGVFDCCEGCDAE